MVANRVDLIFQKRSVMFNDRVVRFGSRKTHGNSFTLRIDPRMKPNIGDMENPISLNKRLKPASAVKLWALIICCAELKRG
jgi:hypothetical protein